VFASGGADVVVHAYDLDAGHFLDHRLQVRSRCFEKMSAYLFEQVSPLVGRLRLHQVLFCGSQDPLEAGKDNIVDQVGADLLWPPAHVFLLKAADPFADGSFDFPLCSHGNLEIVPSPVLKPRIRFAKESVLAQIIGGSVTCMPL
jgi:hypothetical protein